MDLTLGQRIYYTGDMANSEDAGTIVAVREPDKFCSCGSYNIELDDGREILGVYALAFDPSVGRRFWPLDEWLEERRQGLERSQARMRAAIEASKRAKA